MRRYLFLAIGAVVGTVVLGATGTAGSAPRGSAEAAVVKPAALQLAAGDTALVSLALPSRADVESLIGSGVELEGAARALPSGAYQIDAVLTGAQVAGLVSNGARLLQILERPGDGTARYLASVQAAQARTAASLTTVRAAALATGAASTVNTDTLHFLQNYWWTSKGQTFVGTEVATTATEDPNVQITVTWRTASGRTGSFPLQRFSDDNEYQYHFALPQPVPAKPVAFTATSSLGGSTKATPVAWPGVQPPPTPAGYQQDFITQYMTPEDVAARIHRLAHQYPSLVDVINLPNKTQGYRRTASGYLGDPAKAAVIVESVQFGDQGWNGVQVRSIKPAAHNSPLGGHYANRVLTISLATGSKGQLTSTTGQVAAFIRAKFASLFHAYVESGSAGKLLPVAGPTALSDGLKAGPDVPRAPWTVQALRIGVHRDGSRIGVLTYSQEHAREWAVPLVTLEFAERMLANYATDPQTHTLLNDVDIFVVPVTNPDGANYSFNDYNFQRKNMDDYCKGALRDPINRDAWGVDVNRNYAVGSLFDGYFGASLDCLDEVSAGTGELSEPESRNIIALAKAHPNIKYAMNVHSYGGYFMWPPGAYKEAGRITLPRPSIQESAEFLSAAQQIVSAISGYRGTVTWPAQTGPVADVLYSAAGNSADELYYEDGIFAWDFEVGNFIWNKGTQQWDGPGFQPPYPEAHAEAMEYASALVQLVRVADQYQKTHPGAFG
ncbi:MAG TPA: M14 family zinc carboxypeptidase [Jatrophihabitans sp.]|nr:M14 family zinc carboxypeptidase [Jatrophihabitans sp.]